MLAPGLATILLIFRSLVLLGLQGSEVVDQVLHTVSKSNSLEELTLENAGLKSYVSLLVSPDCRLLLLNLTWPPPFLLLTLSPVRPLLLLLHHHHHHLLAPLLQLTSISSHLFTGAQQQSLMLPSWPFLPAHTLFFFVHLSSHNQIISSVCLRAFFHLSAKQLRMFRLHLI